jgi:CO/xanthine dehydrogenase Mo-binding subunit
MNVVGKSVLRADAYDKVTGATKFAGDLTFSDLLYARALRSPLPHARILNVHIEKAKKVAGVAAVVKGDEIAHYGCYGMAIKDQPILAVGKVRYIGKMRRKKPLAWLQWITKNCPLCLIPSRQWNRDQSWFMKI